LTSYGEPRVWLEQFPHGQVSRFYCDHQGLRYQGEVIRADRWEPAWGEPLTQDTFFRIVLLQQRGRQQSFKIQDSRIVLCLPEAGVSNRRGRLTNEVSSIRETLGVYRIQRDTEGELIRTTLQRQLEGTEEQLLGEESVRYSQGRIITNGYQTPDPDIIFSGINPDAWFSRLAQGLLASAYPNLPIDETSLTRVVASADPPQLFQEIFRPTGATSNLISQLGPGLGLTNTEGPESSAFSASPVAGLIRDRLARLPQPAQWPLVHNYLSHEAGLTGELATLYQLLYLHHEQPGLEIRLNTGHQLTLADGASIPGTQITGDLVPYLRWSEDFSHKAATIGPITQPAWNDALLYLSPICPKLKAVTDNGEYADQETVLLTHMAEFAKRVQRATNFLRTLGMSENAAGETASAMDRLPKISGDDHLSIYRSIKKVYQSHRRLEEDLAALDQLSRLSEWQDDIRSTREYLVSAAVPLTMAELSVQSQALKEATSSGPLLGSKRGWEGLAPEITRFKSQYSTAYRAHHQDVHQSLPAYLRELEAARRKMHAHSLLNALPELGEPSGDGLFEDLGGIDPGPSPCRQDSAALDLDATPGCTSCQLGLDWSIPDGELARLVAAIDGVLEDKNRRLSNLLVERVLEGNNDQRLGDFITIVQASDLSALSNTLNEDLLAFIRQLLV
jgi:hypothetical protein